MGMGMEMAVELVMELRGVEDGEMSFSTRRNRYQQINDLRIEVARVDDEASNDGVCGDEDGWSGGYEGDDEW